MKNTIKISSFGFIEILELLIETEMYSPLFSKYFAIFCSFLIFKSSTNTCTCFDANAEAKKIVDSKFDPKVVASILPTKTQEECAAINKAVAPLNGDKPLVAPDYTPSDKTKPYDDLVFALVNDQMTVLSKYLRRYLDLKNQDYVTMIYAQVDDRVKFKQLYDSQHDVKFEDACAKQAEPFLTALKVWTSANRADEPIVREQDTPCEKGKTLGDDNPNWDQNKDGLNNMLMKHTMEFAKTELQCLEDRYGNFCDKVKERIKDPGLAKLYCALGDSVRDMNKYLAQILHDHRDGKDNFAIWIMVLTSHRTMFAKGELDEGAINVYNGAVLRDFLSEITALDTTTKDMLTAMTCEKFNGFN